MDNSEGTIEYLEGTMKKEEVEKYVGKYCVVTIDLYSWRVKLLGIVNDSVIAFSGEKYRYNIDSIQSIREMNFQQKLFFTEKYERRH